jgi:hypothetical protein
LRDEPKYPAHGYIGAGVIIAAEALLFAGNSTVGHWFTPIVWTGYILLVDALVYKLEGRSPLANNRSEFLIVAVISIASWWMFEFYNAPRFWNSNLELWWHYHDLEPNLWLRRVGYDWAFATIFPALFETAELFRASLFSRRSEWIELAWKPSNLARVSMIALGAFGAIAPLIFPSTWFAPAVWLAFIFLLGPLNEMRGWPSIVGDLVRGDWRRLLSLLVSGLVCGFLWEFWNYWALSKWTYTVPYFGKVKIFEMPMLGYLGFPAFAVECWTIYIFVRSLLNHRTRSAKLTKIWIETDE